MVSIPILRLKISTTEKAKSVCNCPQYTTATQVPPTNRLGIAVLSRDAPETQKVHVANSQAACVPTDAIGCLYQLGCRKKQVYSPAVTAVQHAEKLQN